VASLNGSASNGSGNYSYHWEPAAKLINPNVANPQTVNLYATTLFNLSVTDLATGCDSDGPDAMSVIISGDMLGVNPTASSDEICLGEAVQLFALAGGGSGNYTYSWSSPNGYTSSEINPWVTPSVAGMAFYTCEIDDGFNTAEGTVAVNVRDVPFINMGFADTTICVYDSVTLNAGNAGSSFLWSNGAITQTIKVATTGIGFDMQTYTVTVTNQAGCQSDASAVIVFDFSACTGIGDEAAYAPVGIYPNPGNGDIKLVFEERVGKASVYVCNMLGQKVMETINIDFHDGRKESTLQLGKLPEGIYFIRVTVNSSDIYSTKYLLTR
jgi:hypothetical protein